MVEKIKVELGAEAEDYLKLKKGKTRSVYASNLRRFIKFYSERYGVKDEDVFSHFLDDVEADLKLPRRDRKRVAERICNEFIEEMKKLGRANNTIRLYFSTIQNLFEAKGISISGRFVNLPRKREMKENQKHKWSTDEIREFVEGAENWRDKAIILSMFQSGMGVAEICSLDYGQVKKELESGKLPLLIKHERQKIDWSFRTFLGADAVSALNLYLKTRGEMKDDDPLFSKEVKRGGVARLTEGAIQMRFRGYADNHDFIEDNGGANPARPHSLRAAMASKLQNHLDASAIDYFQGHIIKDQVKQAYFNNLPDEELREMYAGVEHRLAIWTTSKKLLEERSKGKMVKIDEDYIKSLGELRKLNQDLWNMVEGMREEVDELREQVNKKFFADYDEFIKGLVKHTKGEISSSEEIEKLAGARVKFLEDRERVEELKKDKDQRKES